MAACDGRCGDGAKRTEGRAISGTLYTVREDDCLGCGGRPLHAVPYTVYDRSQPWLFWLVAAAPHLTSANNAAAS
jgi:hypothetical protein